MRRGEVNGKLEAKFFSPAVRCELEKLKHSGFPVKQLGDLLAGVRYGTGTPPTIVPEGPNARAFIRATDIKDGEIKTDDLLFIAAEQPKHMAKCRLSGGEIILVRSGANTGDCAVVPSSLGDSYAAYDLILNTSPELQPEFLNLFLAAGVGRLQLELVRGRAAQPHVNSEEVSALQVPLPPIEKQRELVKVMEKARSARTAKLADVAALLVSLDSYLLENLSLTPTKTNTRRIFAIRRDAITRLDADFHSPRFRAIRDAIERCPHPAESVAQICERITTGFAAGKQDQAFDDESGVPHLRPLNLNIYGELTIAETKRVPRTTVAAEDWCERGEVLFNNTNSTEMVGKSAIFDLETPCACSNHMTRLKLRNGMSAEFVVALFNTLRSIGYLGLLSTNFNNQAGINLETLSALRIPVPKTSVQTTIAAEVRRRREAARALRTKAEADWAEAKRWFEAQLLGDAK